MFDQCFLANRTRLIVVVALVGSVSASTFITAAQDPPPSSGSIAGRVIDAVTGQPLAKATASFNRVDANAQVASSRGQQQTDSDGRFTFTALPEGTYSLSSSIAGYGGIYGYLQPGDAVEPTLPLGPNEEVDVVIRMWRAGTITGRVVEQDGQPAVGLMVEALRRERGAWSSGPSARTDDRGQYRIAGVRPGTYAVVVTATGRMTLPHAVYFPNAHTSTEAVLLQVRGGEETPGIDVRVDAVDNPSAGRRVSGVLRGGEPQLEAVEVRLVPAAATLPTDARTISTDPRGGFAFVGVAAGNYRVQALRMPRALAAAGFVSTVVPRLGGFAFSLPGNSPVPDPAPPAEPPPTLIAAADVVVADKDIADLELPLVPAARIRGRMVFDVAKPPIGADLLRMGTLILPSDGQHLTSIPQTRIEADGQFRSVGLPPGRYTIGLLPDMNRAPWSTSATTVGAADFLGRSLELGTTDLIDVVVTYTDKETTVRGTVRDPQGRPVVARVFIMPRDPARRSESTVGRGPVKQAQSSPSGRFEFRRNLPGDYLLAALAANPPNDATAPEFLRWLESAATPVRVELGDIKSVDLRVSPP